MMRQIDAALNHSILGQISSLSSPMKFMTTIFTAPNSADFAEENVFKTATTCFCFLLLLDLAATFDWRTEEHNQSIFWQT